MGDFATPLQRGESDGHMGGKGMAVFQFGAMITVEGEESIETGTIAAADEKEAMAKLHQYGFSKVRLERIRGISALWRQFTADFK